MAAIVTDAIKAGALGVSTSRSSGHRLKDGTLAPSVSTEVDELLALAGGLREAKTGVFQMISEMLADPEEEAAVIRTIADAADRPLSFTVFQAPFNDANNGWKTLLAQAEDANANGARIKAQTFVRPIGVMMGLTLSLNPFVNRPSYKAIEDLALEERVQIMRDPEFKSKILAEESEPDPQSTVNYIVSQSEHFFRMGDPPNYAPPLEERLLERAKAAG